MQREDLGSLFARITRRLIVAEEPVLREHGISMWGYVVLTHLAKQPAANQLALATAIGYDKSRLIALLDELVEDGLVVREQDPADRRNRQVRLTPAGEKRLAALKGGIREIEKELLDGLTAGEQRALIKILTQLADD